MVIRKSIDEVLQVPGLALAACMAIGFAGGAFGLPALDWRVPYAPGKEAAVAEVLLKLAEKGVLAGVSLGRLYPGEAALEYGLVVAVTEVVSDEDIAALEAALKEVLA